MEDSELEASVREVVEAIVTPESLSFPNIHRVDLKRIQNAAVATIMRDGVAKSIKDSISGALGMSAVDGLLYDDSFKTRLLSMKGGYQIAVDAVQKANAPVVQPKSIPAPITTSFESSSSRRGSNASDRTVPGSPK